jgi:2-polyprenyl-3-methyl-5-hydroxy-6-metoxy-1,4-benzoquinol methylase
MKIIKNNLKFETRKTRYEIIKTLVKGKDVLDLGCVNHDAKTESDEFWLHKFLIKHAKKVTGLDNDKKELEKLNRKGYRIIYGDAENFDLKKKFDVVVAGELIEHLSNPGNFLQSCKRNLKDDGIIIITTPNAFSFRNHLRGVFGGVVPTNDEHTFWFTPITLKRLCDLNGLNIQQGYYCFDHTGSRIKYFIERTASKLRPAYAPTLLLVLKKRK